MVPSDWKRFQLSELINKVLENEQAIPFDFLVGDELLRSSLGGYTQSKGLTEVGVYTYAWKFKFFTHWLHYLLGKYTRN